MSESKEKTSYSDEELKEFEEMILAKLEVAKSELKSYKNDLNGEFSSANSKLNSMEDGATSAERENMTQLAARQSKYVKNLENALIRIKNRTYGICHVTGNLISKERLRAVPHTTESIASKKARS